MNLAPATAHAGAGAGVSSRSRSTLGPSGLARGGPRQSAPPASRVPRPARRPPDALGFSAHARRDSPVRAQRSGSRRPGDDGALSALRYGGLITGRSSRSRARRRFLDTHRSELRNMRVTLGVGRTGDDRLTDKGEHAADQDAEQLRALGYTSHFDRTMSKWENFSLGFTYLSPVVGVYTVFAANFVIGGPPMWWTYIAVGLGQLLVCLIFGEIVSQFPISGGLYPWARRSSASAGPGWRAGCTAGHSAARWPGSRRASRHFSRNCSVTRARRSRPR